MLKEINKPIIFSAIQPSGSITIANYLGTLMHWSSFQNKNQCFYCIADLHSLTSFKNVNFLKNKVLDTLALYLACGVDPIKSTIFVQSDVYEHCQLFWILSCYSYFGELSRMTQFKSKYTKKNNNNAGLFNYPILMASDILLYQTNTVLIGNDQLQHLELTRKLAIRLNSLYNSNLFTIPLALIPSRGGKILSLQEPIKKMSKSDVNMNNSIFLLEDSKSIIKKVQNAVTDSDIPPTICYDYKNKTGISNLLNIFSIITNKEISDLERQFSGVMYKEFKNILSDVIVNKLKDLKKNYFIYRNDESYLKKIIIQGAEKARVQAQKTLVKIKTVLNLN